MVAKDVHRISYYADNDINYHPMMPLRSMNVGAYQRTYNKLFAT